METFYVTKVSMVIFYKRSFLGDELWPTFAE